MSDLQRPDPDALLAAIQQQEAQALRGRLKVFLGMAAGVGKTYAMLEAAHQRLAEGRDVVVGYVETHGRPETQALLNGLEVIPRQQLAYRGRNLPEMDLDAILRRAPQVVLVDELAHTNVPGARHAKRYQDVLELLHAGIDVLTTVNVQHFESRADAVQQITGIVVHETLPDSVLDLATEVELIDLSPEELRKRLAEGKVYTPERAEVAAQNFFRVGNLTALREMALRLTAERVDHQLQNYMQVKRIAGPWRSAERLLVAVGPSPSSAQLIRWTRRTAYNLDAPWLAVYVETTQTLSTADQAQLSRNLALARELGGEVVMAAGQDVVAVLLRLARQRNVTQIVMGKPRGWRWWRGSLAERMLSASGQIDVYLVSGQTEEQTPPAPVRGLGRSLVAPLRHYAAALAWVGLVTALNLLLISSLDWVGYQVVGLTELLAVLLIAIYLGRGPALLAAAVSALLWNVLFIPPQFTFEISEVQDVTLVLMYFIIALIGGNLTARLRLQERRAQHNAERTMRFIT
ncbi:MAG: sensor histidine kinase KdpD, partial [Anaerolineae bacterium]|nr:sensor histidine kinase KdpD [Anaerolineae bacterium]